MIKSTETSWIGVVCNPHKNSQAVKKGAALKILGEKICGGGQQMAAMMLMRINFNNTHSHY